jgi:hypothetical protein
VSCPLVITIVGPPFPTNLSKLPTEFVFCYIVGTFDALKSWQLEIINLDTAEMCADDDSTNARPTVDGVVCSQTTSRRSVGSSSHGISENSVFSSCGIWNSLSSCVWSILRGDEYVCKDLNIELVLRTANINRPKTIAPRGLDFMMPSCSSDNLVLLCKFAACC